MLYILHALFGIYKSKGRLISTENEGKGVKLNFFNTCAHIDLLDTLLPFINILVREEYSKEYHSLNQKSKLGAWPSLYRKMKELDLY